MKGKSPSNDPGLIRMSQELSKRLPSIAIADRALIEAVLEALLEESRQRDITDLWERQDLAATYWIFLFNGIDQEEEKEIAQHLLMWKAFHAKHSSLVLCVPSSDRSDFRLCSAKFDVVNCPALIFSDSRDMECFVKLETELLSALIAQKGGLRQFLTKVNAIVENGGSIRTVQSGLTSEKFWTGLKIVYSEIKSLVHFSISPKL